MEWYTVKIMFMDTYSTYGWHDAANLEQVAGVDHVCMASGLLVRDVPGFYVLASMANPDGAVGDLVTIPKSCVVSMEVLAESTRVKELADDFDAYKTVTRQIIETMREQIQLLEAKVRSYGQEENVTTEGQVQEVWTSVLTAATRPGKGLLPGVPRRVERKGRKTKAKAKGHKD